MIKVNAVPPKPRPPMPNAKPRLALQRLQQQPGVSVEDYAKSVEQLVGQSGYPYGVAQAVALDRLIIGLQSIAMRTQLLDFLDRSPGADYWKLKEFAVHLDNGGSPDTWARRDDRGPPQLGPASGHDRGREGPPPSPFHLPLPQDSQRNGLLPPPPAPRLDHDLRGQQDQPEPKRRCEEQYARFHDNGLARKQYDEMQRRSEEYARFNDNGAARGQHDLPQQRCEEQYARFNGNGVARVQYDEPQRRSEEYARFNGDRAGGPRRQHVDGEAHSQPLIRDQRGAYGWEWAKAVESLAGGKPERAQPGAGVKQELVRPGPPSWIGCRQCGLAADAQANRPCCPRCGLSYHETRYQICVMNPFS